MLMVKMHVAGVLPCRSGLLGNIPSAALRAKLDAPNSEQRCNWMLPYIALAVCIVEVCAHCTPSGGLFSPLLKCTSCVLRLHSCNTVMCVLMSVAAGVDDLVQLGDKFVSDIRAGRHAQEGWSNSMYGEPLLPGSCASFMTHQG